MHWPASGRRSDRTVAVRAAVNGASALLALAATLLALALLPATALGHAELVQTAPERGARLERSPEQVSFRFNEPVEASFGAVQVYDSEGKRVGDGELVRPGDRSDTVGTALVAGLPDGTYTATYRVVSADSHPISGGLVFVVGDGAATALTVSDLLADGEAGSVTKVGFGVVRAVAYGAMAVVLGGLLFLLVVWTAVLRTGADASGRWRDASAAFSRRSRTVLAWGVAAGALSSVLGLAFQGAIAGGTPVWDALDPKVLDEVLDTRFGTLWGLRALLWLVLGLVVLWPRPAVRVPALASARLGADGAAVGPPANVAALGVVAVLALAIALTAGLSGHAGVTDPTWLLLPADALHVLAMSAWSGCLLMLLVAVPAATRRLEPAARTRVLAGALARVSPIALASVLVLLATGSGQSIAHLSAVSDLWETGFGRAIAVKATLFLALCSLGAHHRRRGIPRLKALATAGEPTARAGVTVRTALRSEIALFAGVLAATSVLVASSPAAAGPSVASERATLGPAQLELTMEPLQVGPNELHLYLFDRSDGTQWTRVEEIEAALRLPDREIGPLPVDLRKAGSGHYVATRADVGVAGDWELRLKLRVSDFDVYTTTLPVEIR
jgi:copper transport protein